MELSQEFKKRLAPDLKKSELCLRLKISRSTLTRWITKELHNFRHLDVIDGVTEVLGLKQEEIFKKEKVKRTTKIS